jgi:hypothetical protein
MDAFKCPWRIVYYLLAEPVDNITLPTIGYVGSATITAGFLGRRVPLEGPPLFLPKWKVSHHRTVCDRTVSERAEGRY